MTQEREDVNADALSPSDARADTPERPDGAMRWVAIGVRGLVGLVVLLIAIGLVQFAFALRPEPERQEIIEQAPLVRTVPVIERSIAREWSGYGTVRAMDSSRVSAQVAAKVVERPEAIEEGARIEAGDLIVRLEAVDFEQRLAAARQLAAATRAELDGLDVEETRIADQLSLLERELDIEKRELERMVAALERGAGNLSESERRQATVARVQRELSALSEREQLLPSRRASLAARLAQQNADVRLREEELARTEIRAPITGSLQSVSAEVGELLSVGAAVARIVDLSRVEAPLRAPVSAASAIAVGDSARLESDGALSASWSGEVARIAPEADAATRTVSVFVVVEQSAERRGEPLLLPGQFVMGRIVASSKASRLIVPRGAVEEERVLVARPQGDGVSARARLVRVRVANAFEGSFPEIDPAETQWLAVELGDDLRAGDSIVVTNLDALSDGALVRVSASSTGRVRTVSEETDGSEP